MLRHGHAGPRRALHRVGRRRQHRPDARGQFKGITHTNFTSENIARSAIEGVIAGMVYAWRAVERLGVTKERVIVIGGAAKNRAVQEIAASMFASEIQIPQPGEYVADGAAKQAAWALLGLSSPPQWESSGTSKVQPQISAQNEDIVNSYMELISSI
ncbi:MAG: hypothetical protein EBU34_11515 [Alphaproteobacteria bacterium]|nr:hypothetical protein [Alphaproteobacteria bacterium]